MSDAASVGLCVTCRWMRTVTNRQGSRFFRCLRAETDPRFVRYPALPVLHCDGFEEDLRTAGEERTGPAEGR